MERIGDSETEAEANVQGWRRDADEPQMVGWQSRMKATLIAESSKVLEGRSEMLCRS